MINISNEHDPCLRRGPVLSVYIQIGVIPGWARREYA